MGRSPCCSQFGMHRGPWTAREDNLLTRFIEWHGEGDWRNLPEKAGLLRCGKSCRLRWLNYLRPTIKRGNISQDEEDLIIRLHRLLGNRWSLIAGRLPGRTDNEIKNYWNSHLSKKLRKQGIDPVTHKPLESKHHVHENTGDNHTHENNKSSSLQDGQMQTGKNEEVGQAKESQCTDYQYAASLLMQQPVHIPDVNRYISFPSGINSNNDNSENTHSHIKKSMQGTMDDLRHSLDEPGELHSPSNQLDSPYSGMTFKSDPCPEPKFCDSVLKMQSLSSVGMELPEPQHQHHSLPFIGCYTAESDQGFRDHLQFCNLEGGSEFMTQNVFQDYSSLILECNNLSSEELSLTDVKATPHPNQSNVGYEFQNVEWPDCPMEGQIEDIMKL